MQFITHMTPRRYFLITLILGLVLSSFTASADVVVLKTGKKFEVEKVWREDDRVWIIFHGMRASIPQSKVARIETKSIGEAQKSIPQNEISTSKKDAARPTRTGNSARKTKKSSQPALPPQPAVRKQDQSLIFPDKAYSKLKWGARFSSIKGLEKIQDAGGPDGIVEYQRTCEDLKLGRVRLSSVHYSFWRDKLYMLTIRTQGRSNYTALRDDILRQFGQGRRDDQAFERYLWTNTPNDMMLQYKKDGEQGLLWLRSSEIDRQFKLSRMRGHASYLKWMNNRHRSR